MNLELQYDFLFDLELTVRSHGWVYLRPFVFDTGMVGYRRVDKLSSGKLVSYQVQQDKTDSLKITSDGRLTKVEQKELITLVKYSLGLTEDLTEFYDLCNNLDQLQFAAKKGLGRLLRGTSLFEDLVKTLCTTNTSWQQTINMVNNLVDLTGKGYFPSSLDILDFGRKNLEKKMKLGYRASYLWELCERIESNDIQLKTEELKNMSLEQVVKILKSIKGFGNYAVNHVLLMIGHFEHIPVDSGVRQYFKDKYKIVNISQKQIEKRYGKWGRWKFLAYQFERIGESYNLS